MYTRSNINETRDKYKEPDVGYKNDKARHGDEQALAITFTRFDAIGCSYLRLNRKERKKAMLESSRIRKRSNHNCQVIND
ncbi:hypothetical protein AAG906_038620 [Vitis piasezkii]